MQIPGEHLHEYSELRVNRGGGDWGDLKSPYPN